MGALMWASGQPHGSSPALEAVCVPWQQFCIGRPYGGARCDVHVGGELLRFFIGDALVKTAPRTSRGTVRNRKAARTREQP